mgnify:CR=1 FL=1
MSWLSQTADAEPALDVASPVSRAVHGIWEADELFRCPLVGMGITLAEQKHLLKKMSLPAVELTPFEMHELFVNAAATENPLSRKMSQLLRRKYEREAAPLRLLSEEDFLAQWKEAFSAGQYVGFLWAAATRRLTDEARRTARSTWPCTASRRNRRASGGLSLNWNARTSSRPTVSGC